MLVTAPAAVAKASEMIDIARPWFALTNVHLIANFESAVRHTGRDERALTALRVESGARIDIAILHLKKLGMTVRLDHSDADFRTGVSNGQVNRTKPVQLA